jgi:hypothetical protein
MSYMSRHIYLGLTKRRIVLFFLTAAVAALSMGMGWIMGIILCSYDAYQIAKGRPAPFDFLEKYIGE